MAAQVTWQDTRWPLRTRGETGQSSCESVEVQRTPTSEPAAAPTRLCSPNPGSVVMAVVVMVLLVVLLVVMVVVLMVVGESVASKCSL